MTTTEDFYKSYITQYVESLDTILLESKEVLKEKDEIKEELFKQKEFISRYTSAEYIEILKWQTTRPLNAIIFSKIKPVNFNIIRFKHNVKCYVKLDQELRKLRKKEKEARSKIIDYATFKFIHKEFNKLLIVEMLKGYEYNFCRLVSTLCIKLKPRKKATINWPSSIAYRKELKAKGKIVKSKTNPHGESWLIYYTDDYSLWWHWNSRSCKIGTKFEYTFFASKYIKKELNEAKNKDVDFKLRFV